MHREAASYSADERLADGCRVEIRALRPDDRSAFLAAIGQTSAESLYSRFFGVRRAFTEQEMAFFLDVDFVTHVALVAVVEEGGRRVIAGGGRYMLVQPGKAEMAFAVVDKYQNKGIGTALLRHLVAVARKAALQQLIAEVLPENLPMLKLIEKTGLRITKKRDAGALHVTLDLA
ncbi:MAG TPA: GNAT family N-acetyltransferase [Xanthobacteraceae bacterium]|jgi:RimJ/RimL family protein N-acetyltransferase